MSATCAHLEQGRGTPDWLGSTCELVVLLALFFLQLGWKFGLRQLALLIAQLPLMHEISHACRWSACGCLIQQDRPDSQTRMMAMTAKARIDGKPFLNVGAMVCGKIKIGRKESDYDQLMNTVFHYRRQTYWWHRRARS